MAPARWNLPDPNNPGASRGGELRAPAPRSAHQVLCWAERSCAEREGPFPPSWCATMGRPAGFTCRRSGATVNEMRTSVRRENSLRANGALCSRRATLCLHACNWPCQDENPLGRGGWQLGNAAAVYWGPGGEESEIWLARGGRRGRARRCRATSICRRLSQQRGQVLVQAAAWSFPLQG